jgi:hypothetical protein
VNKSPSPWIHRQKLRLSFTSKSTADMKKFWIGRTEMEMWRGLTRGLESIPWAHILLLDEKNNTNNNNKLVTEPSNT